MQEATLAAGVFLLTLLACCHSLPHTAPQPVPLNVICPDEKSQCEEGQTCCLRPDKMTYSCCPALKAVCCKDGQHCCYSGQVCDEINLVCKNKSSMSNPFMRMTKQVDLPPLGIICPDQKTYCVYGDTCCPVSESDYGCCPIPNAVCCMDGIHCCPEGSQCDLKSGSCVEQLPLQLLQISPTNGIGQQLRVPHPPHPHPPKGCPDTFCPSSQTCCRTETPGSFACCNRPNGVCCHGAGYCCPENSECNISEGTCDQISDIVKLSMKKGFQILSPRKPEINDNNIL